MLLKNGPDIKSSEITTENDYINRRKFIKFSIATAGTIAINNSPLFAAAPDTKLAELKNVKASPFSTNEKKNSWDDITSYNNFY